VLRQLVGYYPSQLRPIIRLLEHRTKRDLHDLHPTEVISRIWKESSGRYGVRKVWQQLKREGYFIAHCTVARLMQKLGIQGVWRGK
jgi:putative transposase